MISWIMQMYLKQELKSARERCFQTLLEYLSSTILYRDDIVTKGKKLYIGSNLLEEVCYKQI